jgi:hypothetical protein
MCVLVSLYHGMARPLVVGGQDGVQTRREVAVRSRQGVVLQTKRLADSHQDFTTKKTKLQN